jgi:hypothetical protein
MCGKLLSQVRTQCLMKIKTRLAQGLLLSKSSLKFHPHLKNVIRKQLASTVGKRGRQAGQMGTTGGFHSLFGR